MPKTFYDNDGNTLGVFYTKAEMDDKLDEKSGKLYSYVIYITIDSNSNEYAFNVIANNDYTLNQSLTLSEYYQLVENHGSQIYGVSVDTAKLCYSNPNAILNYDGTSLETLNNNDSIVVSVKKPL